MEIRPAQSLPPEAPQGVQFPANQNRDVARAARVLNEEGAAGPGREFSFSVDPKTKVAVVRIVDVNSGELINQFPSAYILDVARQLEQLRSNNAAEAR